MNGTLIITFHLLITHMVQRSRCGGNARNVNMNGLIHLINVQLEELGVMVAKGLREVAQLVQVVYTVMDAIH